MRCIGIIGAGRWGRNIAKSFAKKAHVKKVASSGNLVNLQKMQDVVPGIIPSSIEQILEDKEIEAVVVAVPMENLADIALQCMKSGKHIFLEKPAATSKEKALLLHNCTKDKVCLVNYLYLVDPSYAAFKHAIRNTKTSKVSFVWEKWGTFNNDIVLNLVSHELSILYDTFQPKRVKVLEQTRINTDECLLALQVDDIVVEISINRKSKSKIKSISCETSKGFFMWTPGVFAHDDTELSINDTTNLLDLQRDIFLDKIKNEPGYTNLSLAEKILTTIEEIKS